MTTPTITHLPINPDGELVTVEAFNRALPGSQMHYTQGASYMLLDNGEWDRMSDGLPQGTRSARVMRERLNNFSYRWDRLVNTAPTTTHPLVGQPVTEEDADVARAGSVFQMNGDNITYTKLADERWERRNSGLNGENFTGSWRYMRCNHMTDNLSDYTWQVYVSARPEPGTPVTEDALAQAQGGDRFSTTIGRSTVTYTKLDDGRWRRDSEAPGEGSRTMSHEVMRRDNLTFLNEYTWSASALTEEPAQPETPALAVGDVPTGEQFTALPIGTVIATNNVSSEPSFVKVGDRAWTHYPASNGGARWGNESFTIGDWRVHSLPDTEPQLPVVNVGDPIPAESFRAFVATLPIGATMRRNSGRVVTVEATGRCRLSSGAGYALTSLRTDGWTLVSLPGTTTAPTPDAQAEVQEAMQAVMDTITNMSDYHGDRPAIARTAFAQLGMIDWPTVGQGTNEQWYPGYFPEGTVLLRQRNEQWRLDRVAAHGLQNLGSSGSTGGIPAASEVRPLEYGEFVKPTYANVREFLLAVYEKLDRLRPVHDWCSAVHDALDNADLGRPGAEPVPVHPLTALPIGSVIRHPSFGTAMRTADGWVHTNGDVFGTFHVESLSDGTEILFNATPSPERPF